MSSNILLVSKHDEKINFDNVSDNWDDEKRIERAKVIANKIKTTIPDAKFIMTGDKRHN